jgi:hypothetical protein
LKIDFTSDPRGLQWRKSKAARFEHSPESTREVSAKPALAIVEDPPAPGPRAGRLWLFSNANHIVFKLC